MFKHAIKSLTEHVTVEDLRDAVIAIVIMAVCSLAAMGFYYLLAFGG